MENRNLGCIIKKLLLLTRDTLYCICSFKSTSLSTNKSILGPQKVWLLLSTKLSTKLCKKLNIFMMEGQQYKKHWNKILDDRINPFLPFFSPTCTHHIHKRLFHQICSHSPFRYQDELLMCLGAASQMCKVRQHSAHLQKNTLSQRDVLISDVLSPSSVLTKKCNWSWAWHMSNIKEWHPVLRIMLLLLLYVCL